MKAIGKCHPSNCPTKKECRIAFIVLAIIILSIIIAIAGCSNNALMPDRMGVSFNQSEYKADNDAYRGFGINFQWDLK